MGIREKLNENPAITTGATAGIIIIALIFIIWSVKGPSVPNAPTKAYYTIDDGASYFADDIQKIAPFDHDGKQAVRCYVWKCKGGKPFISHLEKYTDEAKKQIEEAMKQMPQGPNGKSPAGPMPMMMIESTMTGKLVKKPGKGEWLNQVAPEAQEVTKLQCPDGGSMETIEPVYP
ncbi:MAG TPA: hypothetical protein VIL86_02310 [Tepidisphaeraceae bacterium]